MRPTPLPLELNWRDLLHWRPPVLRFDEIEEAHFQHTQSQARLDHFIKSGLFALLVYNLFLLADRQMVPDVFDVALKFRTFIFTPCALLFMLIGWRFKSFVLLLPGALIECLLMLTGIVAAMSMGWLLVQSDSPYAGMYTAGLVPIIIYGNLVQRFRFRYAFLFSLVVIGVAVSCVWMRFGHEHPYAFLDIPLTLLVALMCGHTLVINYRYELEERRRFQWSVRAQALRKKLAASQAQLDEMSRRDPLTGVPNRRHFDEYVRLGWDQAVADDSELGLLLIDVDHFKKFNDHYGHPAGDQCLKLVAQALQQKVPAEQGCVARWGGEEFIVALPGADGAQAMKVAQGLCDAVQGLALRHEASTTAPHVTISVGVAVCRPARMPGSAENLVASADTALYRAKEGGRNRAVAALSPVSG